MKQNLIDKMERTLGKYAIQNLSLYLIICYAFGYVIQMVNANFFNYLTLEPALVLKGQVWRLLTWIVVPPSSSNILFTLLMLYFYYSIGNNMERVWGTYRFNVYIFSGMLFTILGAFLSYGIYMWGYGVNAVGIGSFVSTYYINMSILMAYAATFPDLQIVMLLFIFPVPLKVKWLGILYAFMLAMEALSTNLVGKIMIIASLLNFILFFLYSRNRKYTSSKFSQAQRAYTSSAFHHQQQSSSSAAPKRMQKITKHKCAICGRTEESNPELEFRFCSKCDGNYEYCQDHLFTHEHVKYGGNMKH